MILRCASMLETPTPTLGRASRCDGRSTGASMTDFTHLEALLPPNATAFEKALSQAMDLHGRGAPLSDALPGFKLDAPDALLPWLIWEYGLGELVPYLREPRRVLEEGLLWQRMRGTPESLRMALGWVGLAEVALEQEPPGVHFAEFQLDPGRVLRDDALIADLVAVAKLAAPARSGSVASITATTSAAASCRSARLAPVCCPITVDRCGQAMDSLGCPSVRPTSARVLWIRSLPASPLPLARRPWSASRG